MKFFILSKFDKYDKVQVLEKLKKELCRWGSEPP